MPAYNLIDFHDYVPVGTNRAVIANPVPISTCPSDVVAAVRPVGMPGQPNYVERCASSSYVVSAGPFVTGNVGNATGTLSATQALNRARGRGLFHNEWLSVRFRDATDGLSNTIMVGEIAFRDANKAENTANGADWNGNWYGSFRPARTEPIGNNVLSHMRSGERVLNVPPTAGDGPNRQGFKSNHVGGAHFLLGDGSVRFISENIEHTATGYTSFAASPPAYLGLYQRLFCRNCGLVRGEF
jgi:hypothetical protein